MLKITHTRLTIEACVVSTLGLQPMNVWLANARWYDHIEYRPSEACRLVLALALHSSANCASYADQV